MRYFEDIVVGEAIDLGSKTISKDEIIAFAQEFDPQPFHVDETQAEHSMYGGLIASGWHTCAVFMRLYVDGFLVDVASMGSPGIDNLRWRKPVRPHDTLRGTLTISEANASRSRPTVGIIKINGELFNQDGELVMSLEGVTFVGRRP